MSLITSRLSIYLQRLQQFRYATYYKGSKIVIKHLPYKHNIYTLENLDMHAKQRKRYRKVSKVIKQKIEKQERKNKFPTEYPTYDYNERKQPRV
nr:unnamed protein product [Callosobruchus analis]